MSDTYGGDMELFMKLLSNETSAAPQPMYRSIRADAPVLRFGSGVAVTRKVDIDEVLRCPEVFSSNSEAVDIGQHRPLIPLQIDPPKHVRYRKILDPLFAPRQMALLEPQVATLVNNLIDRFIDKGAVDMVQEFTIPFPSEVFLVLLGLPLSELKTFLRLKDGIIRPHILEEEAWGSMERQQEIRKETAVEIYRWFEAALDERETEPRDDLLSQFLTFEIDGEKLTRNEILDTCFLFLIAGLDTVSASLECFFAYLAANPAQRQRLVEDPSLVPHAVEELLRWETPVQAVPRVVAKDGEVGGCPVKEGDHVMVVLGSANTDDEFPDADTVDFDRPANRHLAFGGGIHRCLGSHLARMELRIALREFHRRIPEYWLAPGASLNYTPGIRSVDRLPLEFATQ